MQEQIKKIKTALDAAGVEYSKVCPHYNKESTFYRKITVHSTGNFERLVEVDSRIIYFVSNPTLRDDVIINERDILSDVLSPWELENNIINIGEMMDSPVSSLRVVIKEEDYNKLEKAYGGAGIIRRLTYDLKMYRKILKNNPNIITSYNLKDIKKTSGVALNDFKGKLQAHILSMDNSRSQRLITRYYKGRLPRLKKIISKYMCMHVPSMINELLLCKLGMCTYEYGGEIGIIKVDEITDIDIWLEAYQILMDKSVPDKSIYLSHPDYFKKEVGDKIFVCIQNIFKQNKEVRITLN